MEYVKIFVPKALMRTISSVQDSLTQRTMAPPQARPYRVCAQDRHMRKGFTASSLRDLTEQVATSFLITCQFLTLVLEDDGTMVESEAFFQSLPINTLFMVLGNGEVWSQMQHPLPSFRQSRRNGIARLTFDLYKMSPLDFLGCFTIKATLFEIYTFSYDIKFTRAKYFLKGLLQFFMYVARLAGQILLFSSTSVLRYMCEEESCS